MTSKELQTWIENEEYDLDKATNPNEWTYLKGRLDVLCELQENIIIKEEK